MFCFVTELLRQNQASAHCQWIESSILDRWPSLVTAENLITLCSGSAGSTCLLVFISELERRKQAFRITAAFYPEWKKMCRCGKSCAAEKCQQNGPKVPGLSSVEKLSRAMHGEMIHLAHTHTWRTWPELDSPWNSTLLNSAWMCSTLSLMQQVAGSTPSQHVPSSSLPASCHISHCFVINCFTLY